MVGACVVVLLSVALTGVWGQQDKPFFDPRCLSTDCSWSWDTPIPGNQFCERIVNHNSISSCWHPFGPPADQNERPPKAKEVHVTEFNKDFQSESYTCLNITYQIDATAANKVKGIQVSVRGNEQPDQSLNYCLYFNFTLGDSALDYYAVENRVFAVECFCGLKPGSQYLYTVRTLPVDDNPLDQDDTKVEGNFRLPNCDHPSKTDDARCRIGREARWSPDCFHLEQPTSGGEYDVLEVRFDVAPSTYDFDKYRVFIYDYAPEYPSGVGGPPIIWTKVFTKDAVNAADRMCSQELVLMLVHRFNISLLVKGSDTEYIAVVQPRPTVSRCLTAEGAPSDCKKTYSSPFTLTVDPCNRNPCGDTSGCVPQGNSYRCDCAGGYMEWNRTCVVDPCMVESERCVNGECHYIYTAAPIDYYCSCEEGFLYLKTPRTCIADPCVVRADTRLTVCGLNAYCKQNLTDDQVSYKCSCHDGYNWEEDGCKEGASIGMIVGITIASSLWGLLLIVVVFCIYRHRYHVKNHPPSKDIPVFPTPQPDQLCYRRVLPIYSEDHPCHKKVIHCFCRMLQEHCKCEISLMDWQTSVVPTVRMWLTSEMDRADLVLLICSKGTGKKYRDKARRKVTPSSDGIYGDVFLQALTLLDSYLTSDDACGKFVVCYFDYSSKDDIPISFQHLAKFHLMKCMDSLFLRIHDKVKDSPGSSRRVAELEEASYMNLELGKPLHAAINDMKELIKRDPKWYQNYNKGSGARETSFKFPKPSLTPVNSLSPQISTDSAYDSTEVQNAFFDTDSVSSGNSVTESDIGALQQRLMSFPVNTCVGVEMPDHHDTDDPLTQFFTDDIRLTVNPGPGSPLQSNDFYPDIQISGVNTLEGRSHSCV